MHPFFDELRDHSDQIISGKPFPLQIFSFTEIESNIWSDLIPKIVPKSFKLAESL
jgi:hypothetical protein